MPRRLHRHTGTRVVALLLGLAAQGLACAAEQEPKASGSRPANVVLILWDTVRADRMSLYGYGRSTTPELEAFAREATVYEHAISPANWTLPAHASLFTGLPASEHAATAQSMRLAGRHRTLAERLRSAGYDTYAFTANPHASERTGVLQGFSTIEHSWKEPWSVACAASSEARLIASDRSTRASPGGPHFGPRPPVHKDCASHTDDAFLGWLDEREDKSAPFFAYLNYMEAHVPRLPGQAARERVLDPEAIASSLAVNQVPLRQFRHMFGVEPYSDAELRAIGDVYDASLVDLDRGTSELLRALTTRGLLSETAVIVTSDHGEHLGEHGQLDHKYSLYDALVRVPLIVRYPPLYGAGRVASPVSTRDIAGTVLRLAGVAHEGQRGLVHSLPTVAGDAPGRPVFAELVAPVTRALKRTLGSYPDVDRSPWLRTMDAVADDDFKLISSSDGTIELYATAVDPDETHDLTTLYPERARRMKAGLDAWKALRQGAPQAPPQPPAPEPALDDATRRQLRALGYLEDPEDEASPAD